MRRVVPVSHMAGEDAEDTELLKGLLAEAESYLASFDWCERLEEAYFGLGVGGIVAVFLFRVRPARPDVDDWLWVIVGDLPPAYLVTDSAPNAACALEGYLGLMQEWVEAVRTGRPLEDLIPVNVPPTVEWATELKGRLEFLRDNVLSKYTSDLRACEDPPP